MKKIVLSLIMILLVVSMSCTVFATSGNPDLDKFIEDMLQEENAGKIEDDEKTEQIPEGTVDPEEPDASKEEEKPETNPDAGLGDYKGLIFVAVFGVLAVYAYKKVKEYNV